MYSQNHNWAKRLTKTLNTSNANTKQIKCPVTDLTLYTIDSNNTVKILHTHSKCPNCQFDIHITEIHAPKQIKHPDYPIGYTGLWCKRCWTENEESPIQEYTF